MHAVVTGGSRGIGFAIVEKLLREGCDVWYLSRTEGDDAHCLNQTAVECGRTVSWIPCDMGDTSSIEGALDTVVSQADTVDVLVNNAGLTRDGLIMRMKDDAWDDVMRVNLTGAFVTCRKISRIMASQRRGTIVNISSVVGIREMVARQTMRRPKRDLSVFQRVWARELASRSVRVNVVAPVSLKPV